jgi:hypothetical protein
MRRLFSALFITALVAAVAATAPAQSAQPGSGALREDGDRVSWTGEFTVSNPAVCTNELDPTCDHFYVEIDPSSGGYVVEIGVSADDPNDDIDLVVYDEAGTEVAKSGGAGGSHSVVLSNPDPGTYEVRVQPWVVQVGATYQGEATLTIDGRTDRDVVIDHGAAGCIEAVPEHVGVAGVTDDGAAIDLDVLVLLDGLEDDGDPDVDDDITVAEVEAIRTLAQEHSYGPLSVNVEVTYQRVHFASDGRFTDTLFGTRDTASAPRLIQDAKELLGGVRPEGIDVVYVATAKDIFLEPGDGVLGLADCIGGVRYDDAAFAVGEAGDAIEGDFYLFGLGDPTPRFLHNLGAKIFAHEVGHLMGAHHHYGQCGPGLLNEYETFEENEGSACTLMFPDATLISLSFGAIEGSVVRGHADAEAR